MNGDGKRRRCTEKRRTEKRRTEKRRPAVAVPLFPAAAIAAVRQLSRRARTRYRWPGRPTTRRPK